jgi:hypothetical protein
MRFRLAALYLAALVPSVFLMAILWTLLVSDRLYYCWDSTPLLDFIPPFVHSNIDARDHYIASPLAVWALWLVFTSIGLVGPLFLVRHLYSDSEKEITTHGTHKV